MVRLFCTSTSRDEFQLFGGYCYAWNSMTKCMERLKRERSSLEGCPIPMYTHCGRIGVIPTQRVYRFSDYAAPKCSPSSGDWATQCLDTQHLSGIYKIPYDYFREEDYLITLRTLPITSEVKLTSKILCVSGKWANTIACVYQKKVARKGNAVLGYRYFHSLLNEKH